MKMNVEKEITYNVKLLCRNCNTDWIEVVEKGTYIRYEKDNNYMIKIGDSSDKRKFFICPKCGANTKISRLPATRTIRQ